MGETSREFNQSGHNGDGCDQHTTHAKGKTCFRRISSSFMSRRNSSMSCFVARRSSIVTVAMMNLPATGYNDPTPPSTFLWTTPNQPQLIRSLKTTNLTAFWAFSLNLFVRNPEKPIIFRRQLGCDLFQARFPEFRLKAGQELLLHIR